MTPAPGTPPDQNVAAPVSEEAREWRRNSGSIFDVEQKTCDIGGQIGNPNTRADTLKEIFSS